MAAVRGRSTWSLDTLKRLGAIDPFSIATGVFAFFIVPLVPLLALGSAAASRLAVAPVSLARNPHFYVELWFLTFAPFSSGYLTAKLCSRAPLLNGVLAGVVGAILFVSWFLCFGSAGSIPLALADIGFGALGALIWRARARRPGYARFV